MQKTKTELTARVRSNLGSPSETLCPSATIGNGIDDAVNEYSRYKPKTVYAEFDTEAGVAEIAMSTVIPGSTVLGVKNCYWDPIGTFWDSDLYRTLPDAAMVGLSGISVYHNPSIVIQYQQKLESFRYHFGGDWEFYDGTLRLLPAPVSAGTKVGVIADCAKTLEEIPDIDEGLILLWAEAQAAKVLMGTVLHISSVAMEGASISFNATALKQVAKDNETEFRKRIGSHLGVFSTG